MFLVFLINKRKLFWSIVKWYLRVNDGIHYSILQLAWSYIYIYIYKNIVNIIEEEIKYYT